MAKLYPPIEQIMRGKQPPTEGELHLLHHLQERFDPDAEVYFQPCFNGDRPDIVIMKKAVGVIIIEVKDWDPVHYGVDENNHWTLVNGGHSLRSPFAQAFHYKNTFFNIHVNGLLEKSLKNENFYNIVNVFVYFHKVAKRELEALYAPATGAIKAKINDNNRARSEDRKSQDQYEKAREHLDRKLHQLERDALMLSVTPDNLKKIGFRSSGKNVLFEDSVHEEFLRLLRPPFHYANQGKPIAYSKKQESLYESVAGRRMKIRGMAGSGKTTVLAKRAVNAHRRHGGPVLILTFNLTLGRYIRDRLNEVREDFSWSGFHISNYHRFITSVLANGGVEVDCPADATDADDHLERFYYSNLDLFLKIKNARTQGGGPFNAKATVPYDTILIDEVQDYKPAWLKIIMSCFLADGGELVLFGDEKQNIYGRAVDAEKKTRLPNGFGKWEQLGKSFRYRADSHILTLASAFQRDFLDGRYEVEQETSFQPTLSNFGINLCYCYQEGTYEEMARVILGIAKASRIHPNDISIVGAQKRELQEVDFFIRKGSNHQERTITTFESKELASHARMSRHARKVESNKKYGFNLNSGVMKLSTVHSFKGYESPTICLLVGCRDSVEMVYTGLTRARENIVVFVHEKSPYRDFFTTHLEQGGDLVSIENRPTIASEHTDDVALPAEAGQTS